MLSKHAKCLVFLCTCRLQRVLSCKARTPEACTLPAPLPLPCLQTCTMLQTSALGALVALRRSVRTKMAEHARQVELATLTAAASTPPSSATDGLAAGGPAGLRGAAASGAAKEDGAEPVQQPVAQLDATAGEQAAAAASLPGMGLRVLALASQ